MTYNQAVIIVWNWRGGGCENLTWARIKAWPRSGCATWTRRERERNAVRSHRERERSPGTGPNGKYSLWRWCACWSRVHTLCPQTGGAFFLSHTAHTHTHRLGKQRRWAVRKCWMGIFLENQWHDEECVHSRSGSHCVFQVVSTLFASPQSFQLKWFSCLLSLKTHSWI